jgi:hypothetical protein
VKWSNTYKTISQAEHPFNEGPGIPFFKSILSAPDKLIQIGIGEFASPVPEKRDPYEYTLRSKVNSYPTKVLSHIDSILRENETVKISSTINEPLINPNTSDFVTFYLGIYHWSFESKRFVSSGWNVTFSGNTWTARYSKGASIPDGNRIAYSTRIIKIPISELFLTPEAKAAAELKAKQEAEAKAAAELKAKQEAEAKAAAELKAKQEAKVAAEKAAAELLLKEIQDRENSKIAKQLEIDSGLAKLRTSLIELAKKYPSLKKGGDSFYGFNGLIQRLEDHNEMFAEFSLDYKYEYYLKITEEVRKFIEKSLKSVKTITCVKGKQIKRVTEIKPVCPAGYKKK